MDASYDLTPEQLVERIPSCDALIIRSATKARAFCSDRVSMELAFMMALPNLPLDSVRGHANKELNPPLRPHMMSPMRQSPCMPAVPAPTA